MDVLIATYLAWIISQTGLALPNQPPVYFMEPEEMNRGPVGSKKSTEFERQSFYNRSERIIYLPQGWQPDDLRQQSALLHELVHHVQSFNNIVLPCNAAYERQAYDLQIRWLREQGAKDPYNLIKTNELSIMLVSTCRDR